MNKSAFASQASDIYPDRTLWTLVVQAGKSDTTHRQRAFGELYKLYARSVYCSIRRTGRDHYEAEDLMQGYFLSLLERGYLGRADPARGKFRAFIQADLKLFLNNEWRKNNASKRGGTALEFSLDASQLEHDYESACGKDLDAETLLDREWAKAIFQSALQQLKQSYKARGNGQLYEELAPLIDKPALAGMYDEIAQRLGTNVGKLKVDMNRMRQRFGEILREIVADTLESPTEQDIRDEIRHLLSSLAAG